MDSKAFYTSLAVWALVFVAMVVVLSGCSTYDLGGRVVDYRMEARANKPRLINGLCASACTLYLTSPTTCYTDRSVFIFHGVSSTGEDGVKRYSPNSSAVFAHYFWPKLTKYLQDNNALRSDEYHFSVTGAQIRSMDSIDRHCDT